MANFLEQLVAEWYEYEGYFVRRNVLVGPRKNGGYDGELDVVAFNPEINKLVHVEATMDALSWAQREKKYARKFELGKKHIPEIFKGLNIPSIPEQIALLGFGSKQNHDKLGGGDIMLVSGFLEDIFENLKKKHISNKAISEHLPILRAFQFVASHRKEVFGVLNENR